VRDDVVAREAVVDQRLEDLHLLARDPCAAQPPDEFFGLAGEHGAGDDFDPAGRGPEAYEVFVVALRCQFFHLSPVPLASLFYL
jgi:hypothetical protein